MSRRRVAVLVVAGLWLVGCSADRRTTTASPGTETPAASPADGAGDAAGAGAGTRTGGGGGKGTGGGDGKGRGGALAAPSPGLSNLPRLGTYVFEVTPLPTSPQGGPSIPPVYQEKSTIEIEVFEHRDAPGGSDVLYELRSPGEGQSTKDYRRDRWTRPDVRLLRSRDCRVDPPITILQFPIKPGSYGEQKASFRECTRGDSETRRITVLGQETAKAAGRSWTTWKIETATTISSGDSKGIDTLERHWFAPELGMYVRTTFETTFPNGVKFFTTQVLMRHP